MFDEYPDIMNVPQMAKALMIGRNKAYELLKNKKIRYIKIGSKYIIPKMSLIEFIRCQSLIGT